MNYLVVRKYNNGYRCSCCVKTWETKECVDNEDIQKVFEEIKNYNFETSDNFLYGKQQLEEITILDNAENGQEIAGGILVYPYVKGYYYDYSQWSGYTPDSSVEKTQGLKDDETWEQMYTRIETEFRGKEIQKRIKEIENLQKEIDLFKKGEI